MSKKYFSLKFKSIDLLLKAWKDLISSVRLRLENFAIRAG